MVAGIVTIFGPLTMGFSAPGRVHALFLILHPVLIMFRGTVAIAWIVLIVDVVVGWLFAALKTIKMPSALLSTRGTDCCWGRGAGRAAAWETGMQWAMRIVWLKDGSWAQWVKEAGMTKMMIEQPKQVKEGPNGQRGRDAGARGRGQGELRGSGERVKRVGMEG